MAKKYLNLGSKLKKLLFDKGMKPIDLAREVNMPPPTIHRLITGKSTRPYKSSLKPIADFFSISVDELTGDIPPLALDSPDEKTINNLLKTTHYLPIIPWEKLKDGKTDKNMVENIPFVGIISSESFATRLNDSSMEPLFPRGSMLLFDSKKTFKDRSFVLVQLQETDAPVFRQLIIDLDQKYLKPLNPDLNAFKMRLLGENDNIIATLVEARQTYTEY